MIFIFSYLIKLSTHFFTWFYQPEPWAPQSVHVQAAARDSSAWWQGTLLVHQWTPWRRQSPGWGCQRTPGCCEGPGAVWDHLSFHFATALCDWQCCPAYFPSVSCTQTSWEYFASWERSTCQSQWEPWWTSWSSPSSCRQPHRRQACVLACPRLRFGVSSCVLNWKTW